MNDIATETREIVRMVLLEALGSSLTPFVPLPFVDDFLQERLYRRIGRKILERRAPEATPEQRAAAAERIVAGYIAAGTAPLASRVGTTMVRFVMRKVAMILDVKKSHDVFGEAIVLAIAFDVALRQGGLARFGPERRAELGAAVFRAVSSIGSAPIEILTRAGREVWRANASAEEGTRLDRAVQAMSRRIEETRGALEGALRHELG